ncbi:hypothetical protein [Nocardiopsis sp. LOL_012]|uniref:hypothetical protein n=1 Tax=Nocardiopsis sp. LOL_012 TaxID=3345409 RepID=UPI003A858FE8
MAELSGVFADSPLDTAETLARLFRQFAPSGVVPAGAGVSDPTDPGDELEVTADGTGIITIGTGYALVGGYWYQATTPITRPVAANASGQERHDLVVVRADPQAGAASVLILPGTPGAGTPPSPAREGAGVWDVVLAVVTVAGNSAVVVPAGVDTRPREYTASAGAVSCRSTHRPATPQQGMLIYETDTHRVLTWSGGTWRRVSETAYPSIWMPILHRVGYGYPGHGHSPQWRWDAPGLVRLQGRVGNLRGSISNGEYVARLPSQARPRELQAFAVASTSRRGSTPDERGAMSRLEILDRDRAGAGRLVVYTPYDPTWIDLSGVTFVV